MTFAQFPLADSAGGNESGFYGINNDTPRRLIGYKLRLLMALTRQWMDLAAAADGEAARRLDDDIEMDCVLDGSVATPLTDGALVVNRAGVRPAEEANAGDALLPIVGDAAHHNDVPMGLFYRNGGTGAANSRGRLRLTGSVAGAAFGAAPAVGELLVLYKRSNNRWHIEPYSQRERVADIRVVGMVIAAIGAGDVDFVYDFRLAAPQQSIPHPYHARLRVGNNEVPIDMTRGRSFANFANIYDETGGRGHIFTRTTETDEPIIHVYTGDGQGAKRAVGVYGHDGTAWRRAAGWYQRTASAVWVASYTQETITPEVSIADVPFGADALTVSASLPGVRAGDDVQLSYTLPDFDNMVLGTRDLVVPVSLTGADADKYELAAGQVEVQYEVLGTLYTMTPGSRFIRNRGSHEDAISVYEYGFSVAVGNNSAFGSLSPNRNFGAAQILTFKISDDSYHTADLVFNVPVALGGLWMKAHDADAFIDLTNYVVVDFNRFNFSYTQIAGLAAGATETHYDILYDVQGAGIPEEIVDAVEMLYDGPNHPNFEFILVPRSAS